jgi:hypothetical protein
MVWDRMLNDDERRELGGDLPAAYEKYKGTLGIWRAVTKESLPWAVLRTAAGIGLLMDSERAWLELWLRKADPTLPAQRRVEAGQENAAGPDLNVQIRNAIQTHRLVLVHGTGIKLVFWDGRRVAVDWSGSPKLWEFFLTLCENAQRGRQSDWEDFGVPFVQRDTIKHRRSRLGTTPQFPANLNASIVPGEERGTVCMTLASSEIHVRDVGSDGWLVCPRTICPESHPSREPSRNYN